MEEARQAFFRGQTGEKVPVLFERMVEPGVYEGHMPNYTPVRVESGEDISGQILWVKLIGAAEEYCTGER